MSCLPYPKQRLRCLLQIIATTLLNAKVGVNARIPRCANQSLQLFCLKRTTQLAQEHATSPCHLCKGCAALSCGHGTSWINRSPLHRPDWPWRPSQPVADYIKSLALTAHLS
eukprot:1170117-Amphidinium_carterae.1